MKKKSTFIKLLLSVVLTGVSALAAGQTMAEYNKANELIKDGQQYRIYTIDGGTKYYFVESEITDDGAKGIILGDRSKACVFTFRKYKTGEYKIGDEICNSGWHIEHTDKGTSSVGRFTNPAGKSPTTTSKYLRRNTKNREGDWETQLLFARESGNGSGEYSYAVRSTANAGTDWGANTFWYTFTPDGTELPTSGYDLTATKGTATYYDFYLEEVDYSQLFGNEEVTKGIFADAYAGFSNCPWRFFKSRPRGADTNAYTDGCDYDAETSTYYRTENSTADLKSDGSFVGQKTRNAFYSIASRYQNLAGEEKWYKVENKVTAENDYDPIYMDLYYSATTATSGNLLNNIVPFHRTFAGKAVSDRVIYIRMAEGSSLFLVPDRTNNDNAIKGTIDYIKVNAVDEADIPAGALCYDGSNLSYTLKVTDAGYATLVLPFAAECPADMQLYLLNSADSNGYIQCTELSDLTANQPVLVKAAEGKYTFTATTAGNDANSEMTKGLLTGTYDRIQMEVGSYVLQNQNNIVGFYKVKSEMPHVDRFRAYIKSSVNQAANRLIFNFGEETSIDQIVRKPVNAQSVFNLQGQRVDDSYRGVVIMNGKKIIKK